MYCGLLTDRNTIGNVNISSTVTIPATSTATTLTTTTTTPAAIPTSTTSTLSTSSSTTASTSTGNNNKFWVSYLANNGSAKNTTDNGLFDNMYPSDKILTRAIKAGRGGYLLVGISSTSNEDSLKVAITNANSFSFDKYGVDTDAVVAGLGKSRAPSPPPNYATAFSAASYNFILTNTYRTATNKSDILLLKLANDRLKTLWSSPVQLGGDGDDTAAAVAELPDGHIIVLGTMQLGNPPAQFKIALMKLNSQGQLAP